MATDHSAGQRTWRSFFGRNAAGTDRPTHESEEERPLPTKWSMGVLNDRFTHEVPGEFYRNRLLYRGTVRTHQN